MNNVNNEKAQFLERLRRNEQHSRVMANELPPGFAKTRAVHILRTARDLQTRLATTDLQTPLATADPQTRLAAAELQPRQESSG
jgi:hypothetical protein